jgi:hypothetical protein
MTDNFYSPLSTVISLDQLPNALNFVTTEVDDILNKIFFQNLVVSQSNDGAFVSISLDIVSISQFLNFEIPGTGIILT